ncbi:MAG: YfiR family protein [Desulfobulbaceae bacterium]|nr:YfiR family protein [Desulfobulbaceae bacterium]
MHSKRLWPVLILFLLVAGTIGLSCSAVRAHQIETLELEYKLKAAFLYNFARFIEWPKVNDPSFPFIFCVLGKDPFGAALSGLQERSIDDQAIKLHYAAGISTGLDQCQMLFVSKSEKQNMHQVVRFTKGKPIVTVSDIEGFASADGMFEFIITEGKLSFIINNSKAQACGLRVSSSLLNLALKVQ